MTDNQSRPEVTLRAAEALADADLTIPRRTLGVVYAVERTTKTGPRRRAYLSAEAAMSNFRKLWARGIVATLYEGVVIWEAFEPDSEVDQ